MRFLLQCTSTGEIRLCIFDDDERERGIPPTPLRSCENFNSSQPRLSPTDATMPHGSRTLHHEVHDKFSRSYSSERSVPFRRVRILKRIKVARFHNSINPQFDTLQIISVSMGEVGFNSMQNIINLGFTLHFALQDR